MEEFSKKFLTSFQFLENQAAFFLKSNVLLNIFFNENKIIIISEENSQDKSDILQQAYKGIIPALNKKIIIISESWNELEEWLAMYYV